MKRWPFVLLAVIVLFGASEALAFARPASLDGERDLIVPAGVRYDRTFEWRGEYVATPALLARTMASVLVDVDASGTEGWNGEGLVGETRGLRVEVTVLANGENATYGILFMHGGARLTGPMGDDRFSDAWRVGTNDVVVRARVAHEPMPGITGQYEIGLGPAKITHLSWLDPPCRPRSACD